MIDGLSHSLDPIEALVLFKTMQLTGVVHQLIGLLNSFPAIHVDVLHAYEISMDFGS